MSMNFSSKGGSDFKPVPSGSHVAVCNMIADLGIQRGSQMYPDPKHKIYIRFELPFERIEYTDKEGKKQEGPRVIGREYTASMHENANLRIDLESWRGKVFTDDEAENFDVASILGKPCMLSVVESNKNGKTYSNIKSISGLPKGTPIPRHDNPLLLYQLGEDGFDKLPEWLQKKVNERIKDDDVTGEGDSDPGPRDGTEITDDDIPF